MLKIGYILLIIVIPLAGVYILAKATGALQFYTATTSSMEPNFMPNKFLIATNLLKPERGDAVSYKSKSLEIPGLRPAKEGIFLGRLIGFGGDTLQIKNGYAYIDGKQVDKNINLKFTYTIEEAIYQSNRGYFLKILPADATATIGNKRAISLDDDFYLNLPIKNHLQRLDFRNFGNNTLLAAAFRKPGWTINDLGPIEIPPDSVFILGDFRHNAEDSRITGFVSEKDIKGLIIN